MFGLSGCNQNNLGSNNDAEKSVIDFTLSAVGTYPIVYPKGSAELTVWAILSSSIEDYSTNYQSEWYEEYSGVTVHWVNVPAQGWADAFQKSVMDGEFPDIYLYEFDTSEVLICSEYGAIIPLNNLIDENCPNIKRWFNENEGLKDIITSEDGNIYTLFSKNYNRAAYTQKLWVNKNWLAEYEFATGNGMPKTTEEFKQMLKYFKNNDMNGNGDISDEIPYMGYSGLDGMYYLFDAFIPSNSSSNGYGCYVDDSGNIRFSYDTNEFRDAIKFIRGIYEEGLISDQSFTISSSDRIYYTSSDNGETIVGVASSVDASGLVQLSVNGSMDYSSYIAIPPLKGPNDCQSYVASDENQLVLRNAITSKCENPELAARWLDYWYSEEGRLWSVNGGLEGIDWEYASGTTIDDDGKVIRAIEERGNNFSWAGQGVSNMLTSNDILHMDISNLGRNNVLATYNADKVYSTYRIRSGWPTIVWITDDNMSAANEYSELCHLIENHVEQNYTDFIMGNKDINDDSQWNEYILELNNMGLSRYIELVELYINSSN